jgi:hypothetical protein
VSTVLTGSGLRVPLPTDALRQNLGTFWSEDCQAFTAHWASLRGPGLMPTTEAFMDCPSARFAPDLYIVELLDDVALVRLQGTSLDARWPAQLTGRDLHEGLPASVRRRSLENMRKVVRQPCGYLARNAYTTSLNRTLTADLMQLPLAVRAGRAPRLVCLTPMLRNNEFSETVMRFHTDALAWLDLGAGVPRDPPYDLID